MVNRDIQVARDYHQGTKHSPLSVQTSRHSLDWDNQPLPYKVYTRGEKIPLPADLPVTHQPALPAITDSFLIHSQRTLNIAQLAYLLFYSAGITKKLVYPQGEIAFRAAACAGALYPIEIYLVCAGLEGFPSGVYHFNPEDFSLTHLRSGDFRAQLLRAGGEHPDLVHPSATLVYTALTWRSSWKYQARAYRYHFWDCGTILANSLAACSALQLPARVVMGFIDDQVNRLIAIDGIREKCLCLLPVGKTGELPGEELDMQDLVASSKPLSREERTYQLIEEMHLNSRLIDKDEVQQWRAIQPVSSLKGDKKPEKMIYLNQENKSHIKGGRNLEDVIVHRGSARRFKLDAISLDELSTLLRSATRDIPIDWPVPKTRFLNRIYLSVHAVDGLEVGKYRFWPEETGLELLEAGDFRSHSAYLCLGQELGGTASVTVFFLADLDEILRLYGNRGYRIVQMEAGILGGKLYLGAYALGRGATGLTFFDDEVVRFFSPSAAGLETIFVTAIGIPAAPSRRDARLVYLSPGEIK